MTRAHGTHEYFRHGGSIGCRLTPQRVHKGKRMAGQMGNEKVTSPEPPAVPHPRRRELHPRPRRGPGRGERVRRRDQGRDAHRVQAQGHGQGRGSLEEPAQGLEEGGCGSRLSRSSLPLLYTPGARASGVLFLWPSVSTTAPPATIAFTRRRRRRASSRARSSSSKRSTSSSSSSSRASACSISAARRARGCSTRGSKVGDEGVLVGLDRAPLRGDVAGRADRRRRRADDRRRGAARRAAGVRRRAVRHGARYQRHPQPRSGALARRCSSARSRSRRWCSRPAATSSASCSRAPTSRSSSRPCARSSTVAKTAKPASSRQISIEQYVIGKGFKQVA